MKVNIKKELKEEKSLFGSIFNKAPNTWYLCEVNIELNSEELQIYNLLKNDKDHKGVEKDVFIMLPHVNGPATGVSIGDILNSSKKNTFFAKNNIELSSLESKINEEAKLFKKMLIDYNDVKSFNSENKSGSSSFEI